MKWFKDTHTYTLQNMLGSRGSGESGGRGRQSYELDLVASDELMSNRPS